MRSKVLASLALALVAVAALPGVRGDVTLWGASDPANCPGAVAVGDQVAVCETALFLAIHLSVGQQDPIVYDAGSGAGPSSACGRQVDNVPTGGALPAPVQAGVDAAICIGSVRVCSAALPDEQTCLVVDPAQDLTPPL
jgi:hypothetical protein